MPFLFELEQSLLLGWLLGCWVLCLGPVIFMAFPFHGARDSGVGLAQAALSVLAAAWMGTIHLCHVCDHLSLLLLCLLLYAGAAARARPFRLV